MVERPDRLDLIQRAAKRLRDSGTDVVAPPQQTPVDHAPLYDLLEKNPSTSRQEFIGPARNQDGASPSLSEDQVTAVQVHSQPILGRCDLSLENFGGGE